jgi:hypothetical protein
MQVEDPRDEGLTGVASVVLLTSYSALSYNLGQPYQAYHCYNKLEQSQHFLSWLMYIECFALYTM